MKKLLLGQLILGCILFSSVCSANKTMSFGVNKPEAGDLSSSLELLDYWDNAGNITWGENKRNQPVKDGIGVTFKLPDESTETGFTVVVGDKMRQNTCEVTTKVKLSNAAQLEIISQDVKNKGKLKCDVRAAGATAIAITPKV